jgi:hypothetical protein
MTFIIMQFLHDPSSSLLGSSNLHNTVLKSLILCSSLKVRDQVSHPYSTNGKITILYVLIFSFFIWDGKTKDFGPNDN